MDPAQFFLVVFALCVGHQSTGAAPAFAPTKSSSIDKFVAFVTTADTSDSQIVAGPTRDLLKRLPLDTKDQMSRNDTVVLDEHVPTEWIIVMPEQMVAATLSKGQTNQLALARVINARPMDTAVVAKAAQALGVGDNLADFLGHLSIPQHSLRLVARSRVSWTDDQWKTLWNSNVDIALLQRPESVHDLDGPMVVVNVERLNREKNLEGEDLWLTVPEHDRKLWYSVIKDLVPFGKLVQQSLYHPLVVGVDDKSIRDWLKEWTQQKHMEAINFLASAVDYLTPTQIQLLQQPFKWSVENVDVKSTRKQIRPMLDVTQLQDMDYTPDIMNETFVPWPVLYRVMEKVLGDIETTSISPLLRVTMNPVIAAYPAMTIQREILSEDNPLTITQEVLANASSSHLSFGQALVLVSGYIKHYVQIAGEDPNVKLVIPENCLFAMPAETILLIIEDTDSKLDIMTRHMHKQVPSQQFALYYRMVQHKFDIHTNEAAAYAGLFVNATWSGSPEILLRYVTPHVARQFKQKIVEEFHRLPDKQKNDVHYFPKHILTTWLEKETDVITSDAVHYLRGITCDFVKHKVHPANITQVLSAYHAVVYVEHEEELKTLPLSLRKCFVDKLLDFLALKQEMYGVASTENKYNMLSVADVRSIGGAVLTGLNTSLVTDKAVRGEIIYAIGQTPLAELLPLLSHGQLVALAKQGLSDRHSLDFDTLVHLGNLLYFADIDVAQVDAQDAKLYVDTQINHPHDRSLCLPKAERLFLEKLIKKAYGSPSEWSASQLINLGDMLIALSNETMDVLDGEALRTSVPFILRKSLFHSQYTSFPGFVANVPFLTACHSWLVEEADAEDHMEAYQRLQRTYLLSSQAAVDIALGDTVGPTYTLHRRRRRQTNEDNVSLHDKTAAIVRAKFNAGNLTSYQIKTLRFLVDELQTTVKNKVSQTLNLNFVPENIQATVQAHIDNANVSSNQVESITRFSSLAQKLYVRNVTELLGLTEKDFNMDRTTFCEYMGCNPGLVLGFTPGFELLPPPVNPTLPTSVTCQGIVAAGKSAVAVTPNDLRTWTSDEIYNCIDVLGNIDWPVTKKLAIWDFMRNNSAPFRDRGDQKLNGGEMLLLRNLLEAVAIENPFLLELGSSSVIEPLSILGTFDAPTVTLELIMTEYMNANHPNVFQNQDTNILHVAAFKDYMCSLSNETVKQILEHTDSQRSQVLQLLGSITRCHNPQVLSVLARAADKELFGQWTPADVIALGPIVAGLSPERLSQLNNSSLEAMKPVALAHLSKEQWKALKPHQLALMSPEGMTVVNMYTQMMPEDDDEESMMLSLEQIDAVANISKRSAEMMDEYKTMMVKQRSVQEEEDVKEVEQVIAAIQDEEEEEEEVPAEEEPAPEEVLHEHEHGGAAGMRCFSATILIILSVFVSTTTF